MTMRPKALAFLRSLWLILFLFRRRQLRRRRVNFAAAILLYLVAESGSVIFFAGESVGLALVIPAPGIQTLRFLKVRDRFRLVAGLVELLAQAEFGGGLKDIGVLRGQLFPQMVFAHHVGALVALFHPVFQRVEIRRGIHAGEVLEAVIDKRNFIGTDDAPLLVDPDAGGHVDHVVQLGDKVLLVDQQIGRASCRERV